MVLVCGSKSLAAALTGLPVTGELSGATVAVLEMPGNRELLLQIPGHVPVFAIITGNVNFSEYQALKRPNVITADMDNIAFLVEKELSRHRSSGAEGLHKPGELYRPLSFEEPEDGPETAAVGRSCPERVEQCPGRARVARPLYPGGPEAGARPAVAVKESDLIGRVEISTKGGPGEAGAYIERPAPQPGAGRGMFADRSRRGFMAAVFSSEGGSGKTFTTSNIAGAAALGRVDTVAVDLDITYGDLEIAVGLISPEDGSRTRVADSRCTVPPNGWATVSGWRSHAVNLRGDLLRHSSGLYVLPIFPYVGNGIPGSEVEELLLTLSDIFSFVVVDLGVDSKSEHARTVLRLADLILYVGRQDTKTLGKGSHFLAQGEATRNLAKTKLLINMANPLGYYDSDSIAKKLGFGEFEEIPLDMAGVTAAKRSRKMAVQMDCQAGLALSQIAARHLPFNLAMPEVRTVVEERTLWTGLKKLFARRK